MLERAEKIYLELRATRKFVIDKAILEKYEPDDQLVLASNESIVLSHWLAARYKRAAFPNALLNRLGKKNILDSIGNSGKKNPHAISGIFLDYDPQGEVENDREIYELWIYVVFSSEIEDAQKVAQELAISLKQRMERAFLNSENRWHLVELRECQAVSDAAFSLNDAKRMKYFRLDYVSYVSPLPQNYRILNSLIGRVAHPTSLDAWRCWGVVIRFSARHSDIRESHVNLVERTGLFCFSRNRSLRASLRAGSPAVHTASALLRMTSWELQAPPLRAPRTAHYRSG